MDRGANAGAVNKGNDAKVGYTVSLGTETFGIVVKDTWPYIGLHISI